MRKAGKRCAARGAGALLAAFAIALPVAASASAMPSPASGEEAGHVREEERIARREARRERRASGGELLAGACQATLEAPAGEAAALSGEGVSLSGRVGCTQNAPADGRPVTLYQHEAGTPGFHAVASTATAAGGDFEFTLPGLEANSAFFVRAAGLRSPRVRVMVRPLVTLQAKAAGTAQTASTARRMRVAAVVTFSGTVTPTYASGFVVLQRELPGARRWRSLGRTPLGADGTYTITRSFGRAGVLDVRAVVHHRGTLAAASPTLSYETPARQNPRLTIQSSANPLTFGQAVTISGKLSGGAARPVALLARTGRGGFARVDETTSDEQGSYAFPPRTPLQSTAYRVRAAGVRSTVLRVAVAPQIALSPPPASVGARQPLSISGTVTPAGPGQLAYLERENAAGLGFRVVAVAAIGTDGSFAVAHTFLRAGPARLRVTVPGGATHAAAIGAPFTVLVTPGGEDAAAPAYELAE